MVENDGVWQTMTAEPGMTGSRLVPRYRVAVAVAFIVTLLVSLGAIWLHMNIIRRDNQEEALVVTGYQSGVLTQHLNGALSATYALAVVLRENGYRVNPPAFERLATDLLRFHPGAASLQYAPGGVVQHIVPLAGNDRNRQKRFDARPVGPLLDNVWTCFRRRRATRRAFTGSCGPP